MNVYSTNHPLIANTGEYVRYKKIVSIHSEDRNIKKFPMSSQFEIELPEELTNIETVKLVSWSFPSNYNVFSVFNKNLVCTFKFTSVANISNPSSAFSGPITDPYQLTLPEVYNILITNIDHEYVVNIEEGSYSPKQLAMELENMMNEAVQLFVYNTMISSGYPGVDDFINGSTLYPGGYNGFRVVFNEVSHTIWLANNTGQFTMTNNSPTILSELDSLYCTYKSVPDYSNYGLPSNLGLPRDNITATEAIVTADYRLNYTNYKVPVNQGGSGDWIYPDPLWNDGPIYYLKCPKKINLMGNSHFYMDISGLNNIDETYPYSVSTFTNNTNQTNGKVESAFAKIAIPGLPLSMWYDSNIEYNYKYFDPPAERLRRLNITIRYHNGMLVNFDDFNFTFCLEFTVFAGVIPAKYNLRRI
jgi:hypothetical protein